MARRADGDGIQPGPGQVADRCVIADRNNQRQGAGPECSGQGAGAIVEDGDAFGLIPVGDVRDQRVEPGPTLGLEDCRDRDRISGIRRQPIDGLGRQDDQPAGAERLNGGGDVGDSRHRGLMILLSLREKGEFRPHDPAGSAASGAGRCPCR